MSNSKVQLYSAKIPGVTGLVADHFWFVIEKDGKKDRWEVWQHKNCGGCSWDYLHKNLLPPTSGVGNGDGNLKYEWSKENSIDLIKKIEQSPNLYQFCNYYSYWPGPNSNTYVQWILQEHHLDIILDPTAIGKDYLGIIGIKKSPNYFHFSTPILGVKIVWATRFEIAVFTLTFGVNIKPFKLLLPFFRDK